MRDVLPALGGEVAIAVKVPRVFAISAAAVIEVKDRGTLEPLVDRLFEKASRVEDSPITMEKTQFKDVEITSLGTFPVPDMPLMKVTPAYAFVGDFLVFATHPNVVKVIVNVAAGKDDITDSDEFQAMRDALPGEPAVTFYMDLVGLSRFAAGAGQISDYTDREHLGFGLTVGGDAGGVTLGWWCRPEMLELFPFFTQGLFEGLEGLGG